MPSLLLTGILTRLAVAAGLSAALWALLAWATIAPGTGF